MPASPDPGPVTAAAALRVGVRELDVLSPDGRALLADWLDRVTDGAAAGRPAAAPPLPGTGL